MTLTQRTYSTQFHQHLTHIQGMLERLLQPREPQVLWEAMRHGVLQGGKRIRPVLLLEACLSCGGMLEQALPTACAVEFIHCYSLIHDDLPCMDNDDWRRGVPTVHKAFSEDMAVLAGDALLAMAFGIITDETREVPDKVLLKVTSELSRAAGVEGLVNGQVDDIVFAQTPPDAALLYRIHAGKTGALFRFSTRAGAWLAGQPPEVVAQLGEYGETLGLAFQIKDDLLDVQASQAVLGKTPGKDQAQGKMTFPAVFGVSASQDILRETVTRLHTLLDQLPASIQTGGLRFLVDFIEARES